MKKCNSINKKGDRCSLPCFPLSRYCWHHQDITWLVGTFFSLISIGIALFIFFYQEKSPKLTTHFDVDYDNNPCSIRCTIYNFGRGEANNVFLSFNKVLPLDTKIFASAELGLELIESDVLPNPLVNPILSEVQKAFSIKVPRIAAKDSISFVISTINQDNIRAGKQIKRIRTEIDKVLFEFGERLEKEFPNEAAKWDLNTISSSRSKDECIYVPSKISYEKGRFLLSFYTDEEIITKASCQELYAKYKNDFIDIFQDRPRFLAPVIRTKTNSGPSTYAIFPPYIETYINFSVPIYKDNSNAIQINDSTYAIEFEPPVPISYE